MIDLFCGVGSASLGFKKAGFEITGALDIDEKACHIYRHNLGVGPINEDIRRISGKRILEFFGFKRGEVDLIIGCPPCQAFSSLGRTKHSKRPRHNERQLVEVFAKRIVEILPTAVVLENVPGILRWGNSKYVQFFITKLTKAGYSCVEGVLESAHYGVPQFRKRVVVLAVPEEFAGELEMPPRTHFHPQEARDERTYWLTVRDAIGDLPPLQAGESHPTIANHAAPNHSRKTLEIIHHIPKNGGSRRDLPKSLWLSCHLALNDGGAENVYGRMRWDEPSPTITTRCNNPSSGRFVHPEQDRAITLREAARLQTFPDDFELRGSKSDMGIWIGNAIPTKLAEVLGKHIIQFVQ